MNPREESIMRIVNRIMKDDAAGRREPDPQLLCELKRLVRNAETTANGDKD